MGLIKRWWSYTGNEVPLWKVFWLFWAIPFFAISFSSMLIFFTFHPYLFKASYPELVHGSRVFSQVMAFILLPLNLVSTYFIYKARLRCQLTYFAIMGLIVVFFSTLQDVILILSVF